MGTEKGDNAEQVKRRTLCFCGSHDFHKSGVLEKGSVRDGRVDPDAVSVDPSPGANMQMARLRVADGSRRKSYSHAGSLKRRPGINSREPVHDRGLGAGDEVARHAFIEPPAVEQ